MLPCMVLVVRWAFAPIDRSVPALELNNTASAQTPDRDVAVALDVSSFDAPLWRELEQPAAPVAKPEPTIKAPQKPPYRLLAIARLEDGVFEARFIHASKPEGVIAAQIDHSVGDCAVESVTATAAVLRDQSGKRHTYTLDLGRRVQR